MARKVMDKDQDLKNPFLSDLVKGDVIATTVNGCAYGDNPSKEDALFRDGSGGPDSYTVKIAKRDWNGNRTGE